MFKRLRDILTPPDCAGCGRVGDRFCRDCMAALRWVEAPICETCGCQLIKDQSRCFDCMRFRPKFKSRAATWFDDPIRSAIHKFKYSRNYELADDFAEIMQLAWDKWAFKPELVIPIPLHAERQRDRGYNQSALLAEAFCARVPIDYSADHLFRVKNTLPQAKLAANKRHSNVQDAFAITKPLAGQRILLIDDVVTTGSTLTAAAETLLDAGASTVIAYCLCRALSPRLYQASSEPGGK